MATEETHRLQPDPPEGDRATIERELKRQDERSGAKPQPDQPKPDDQPKR